MAIWIYKKELSDKGLIRTAVEAKVCVFCNSAMTILKDEGEYDPGDSHWLPREKQYLVRCCPVCGWWVTSRKEDTGYARSLSGACAILRELNLSDQATPIEEVRSYLAAKYDERFKIDPWKFENVVASVYKDLGYQARVTARSGDGGIDIILDGPSDTVIGVQVKRYKGKINVEQIRSFTGALFLEGITRGIFVTTSSFQSGAYPTAEKARLRGIPIELVDAERFYHALGLAQRKAYKRFSDRSAPYYRANLVSLEAGHYDANSRRWVDES